MLTGILKALDTQTQQQPDAQACADHARHWTFRELSLLAELMASRLKSQGIEAGDRVAVLTYSHLDALVVMLGAMRIGAIFMPLNWRLAADELDYVLQHGAPSIVIVDSELYSTDSQVLVSTLHWCDTVQELSKCLADAKEVHITEQPPLNDEALLLYSSGTTGRPKGVLLSGVSLMSAVQTTVDATAFGSSHIMANALPVFHIAGVISMLVPVIAGGLLQGVHKFEPRDFTKSIAQHKVTHTTLVPSMIQMLLAELSPSDPAVSTLKAVTYAGSPINEPLLKKAIDILNCDFVQIYGLTEACGIASILSSADHQDPALWTSAGMAASEAELCIMHPQSGLPVAEGEVGEIWVKSVRNMLAYWGDAQAATQTLVSDGWLRTGDCGHTRAGYLYITDRLKDQIVSGGENIYPAEVERVLAQHPAVADSAVIGVPDEKWGETVKACVVLHAEAQLEAEDLIIFSRSVLAHYKCPTSVDFLSDLPRNASGKVLKRELREPYWQDMTRAVS